MKQSNTTALIILDGFGYSKERKYNAVAYAKTPNITRYFSMYPYAILDAAGTAVGLPEGYIGNSQVGHLTIGAGRIVEQPETIWLKSIDNESFFTNNLIVDQLAKLQRNHGSLHVMGLLSDAGIHAHEKQIHACIFAAARYGIQKIFIHPFLDGRDVPPQSAYLYLKRLDDVLKQLHNASIGSIHGRFYAMDRDNNWERTERSYRILTEKQKAQTNSWEKILEHNYAGRVTDEFIVPIQLNPDSIIKNGDGIIFCNFRPDRARQLTASFIQENFNHFCQKPINLTFFITPTKYSDELETTVLFPTPAIQNTLKEILAAHNKTIFSIAETEKYAHVTYFFNGGKEAPLRGETQVLVPSIHAKNYIQHPEMSSREITQKVLESLQNNPQNFYLINYANADMVGHSGNFGATIKAIEIVDTQLGQLYEQIVEKLHGTMYITADHGKAEDMYDEKTNQPRTAHTNNPVPFIMIQKELKNGATLPLTQLADIAPFILKNMGL